MRGRLSTLELKRIKHDSCDSITFRGGQILVHEEKGATTLEIHTKMGWRMSKWINPFRVSKGRGGGESNCDARVVISYSHKRYWQDRGNMEMKAGKNRGEIKEGSRKIGGIE